jgi:hypothetical protein
MWLWLLGGWIAAAVALAVCHHRLRQLGASPPEEVEEFLIRLETALRDRHPGVRYLGLMPGRFAALLSVRGQETPVDLGETFFRVQGFPDRGDATIDRLVQEVETYGLDELADHDFGGVATWILPQVRSQAWVMQQGRFGDGGLVHRRLGDDLAVVYVIDQDQSMVFVCHAHLRRWRKSEPDLFHLALSNLNRLGPSRPAWARQLSEPMVLCTGDGYDAARVLLLDPAPEGLLVAIPDRDLLWLGREGAQDLAPLMATARAMNRSAPHPVSPNLYRVRSGRLETVRV